jgi:phage-related protein
MVAYDVEFYQKENGDIPVMDFLLSLQPKMRAKAYSEIELLKKHGADLREPYVKSIKGDKNKGIYELRIKFASDISRIFYFSFKQNIFVLLNGFIKKSNKTPERELERARNYKKDYERRCRDE